MQSVLKLAIHFFSKKLFTAVSGARNTEVVLVFVCLFGWF